MLWTFWRWQKVIYSEILYIRMSQMPNRPLQLVHFVFPFQTMWCPHGNFSFVFFISYAYICTCIRRHLKETIPSSSISRDLKKENKTYKLKRSILHKLHNEEGFKMERSSEQTCLWILCLIRNVKIQISRCETGWNCSKKLLWCANNPEIEIFID